MAKKYIQDFKSKLATGGTVSPEELQDFFSRLEGDLKDKKYGLVWESQTEQVIEQLKTNKVYLEEDESLKITQDPDNPKSNILIEGDNYEALTYLNEINQKVDVIYIDPPYNTGNKDFIYNDRFIDKEDGFRHSQWLSFMDARLRLARELLTDDGVIFISIDDNELYQLKLLCDQIFGESNFIANIKWVNKKEGRSLGKGLSGTTEYVLMYSKGDEIAVNDDKEEIDIKDIREDSLGKYFTTHTLENSNSKFNQYTRPNLYYPIYVNRETDEIRVEIPDSELGQYDTILPPLRGDTYGCWRWDRNKIIKEGNVNLEVVRDGRSVKIYTKRRIEDIYKRLPYKDIYELQGKVGSDEIKEIFGEKTFDHPKPVKLVKRFINHHPNENATVLDFFAGSGTTGHAVLELNQDDGGNRQFILVTNNENNIAEEVTYERLKRVMNGYTTPKGKDVPGIPSNLAYYKTKQVSKYDIDFDEVMLQHIIPTIQLTEGVYHCIRHSGHILQLGENIFIFNQYMVEDDEIDTLVGLVKDEDILYIQEGQVDYIKTKLPDGVVYKYLEDVLPTNR